MKSRSLVLSLYLIASLNLIGCATVGSPVKETREAMIDSSPSASHPIKVIESSTRTYPDGSNTSDEIKAFYLHLLESNLMVKQQFESLTIDLSEEHGPHFHAYDPQVIEWFPSVERWNAPEEFKIDINYLVIQPVGYGRSRHAGNEAVIVSEFKVIDSGKAIEEISPQNPEGEQMSTTTTITFLGFRRCDLRPIEATK